MKIKQTTVYPWKNAKWRTAFRAYHGCGSYVIRHCTEIDQIVGNVVLVGLSVCLLMLLVCGYVGRMNRCCCCALGLYI